MPRYRKEESGKIREETRRRLLEAALSEFAQEGYAGANINSISQAAGYAQGTVYNYFPGKRALFQAVVQGIAARHTELILQGAASASQPAARLERFFSAGLAFAQGFAAEARVITGAFHSQDPEVRAFVYGAYERLLSYLEHDIVQAGVLERAFRSVDARLAASAIWAVYLGGCSPGDESGHVRLNPRGVAALLLDGLRNHE